MSYGHTILPFASEMSCHNVFPSFCTLFSFPQVVSISGQYRRLLCSTTKYPCRTLFSGLNLNIDTSMYLNYQVCSKHDRQTLKDPFLLSSFNVYTITTTDSVK